MNIMGKEIKVKSVMLKLQAKQGKQVKLKMFQNLKRNYPY